MDLDRMKKKKERESMKYFYEKTGSQHKQINKSRRQYVCLHKKIKNMSSQSILEMMRTLFQEDLVLG